MALVSISFYLMSSWVYFVILELSLMAVLLGAFMKMTLESPLFIMVASGNHDLCKFILNSIAIINEEEIIKEKLAISLSQEEAKMKRTFRNIIRNLVDSRLKMGTLSILAVSWIAYTIS
jgi:hypothetical protein